MSDSKQCRRCGETKASDMFTKAKNSPDGLHAHCKACRSKRNSAHKSALRGNEAVYVWPRPYAERMADFAVREWRTARPVGAVFAPSLGLSA